MRCPMRCPACGAQCGIVERSLPQSTQWQCRNRGCEKGWSVHDFEYEELARAAELARADVLAPHPLEAQKRRVVAAALEKEVEERKAKYGRQEDADKMSGFELFSKVCLGPLAIIAVVVGLIALAAWCSPTENKGLCNVAPEACKGYPVIDDPRH